MAGVRHDVNAATPLVSVLIRSMDRPQLKRALDSVAAQTYPAIDVVVVAACGPAHRTLPERCGAFPLRTVVPAQPLARAAAANAALDAARGEWLNLLDDDDALLPDHVATLLGAVRLRPDVRLAHARSYAIDATGARVAFGAAFKPWRQLDSGFFHSQAALFARTLCDEGARFDPQFDILEDMDFFVQCAQRTAFAFVDAVTSVSYRAEGNSGTGAGAPRDDARTQRAAAQLRAKWQALDRHLQTTREFRRDKALWLLEHGEPAARGEIDALLTQFPDWPDALALAALDAARRGERAAAQRRLDAIGARALEEPALERHLGALRAWLAAA